jgi:hypothetical protein
VVTLRRGHDQAAFGRRAFPLPRQQFRQPALRDFSDAGEDIGQSGERIDVVEFRCHDQRRHSRRPIGSAFGSGEQPRLTSESKTAQRPLGSVVAQTDPSILEEACKAVPALEQIVDRLNDSGRSRQAGAFLAQPSLQLGKERGALLLPDAQAPVRAGAVDGAPSERLSLTINVRLCRTARRCASPPPARSAILPALPCHAAHWRRYRPARRTCGGRAPNTVPT